MSVPKQCQSRFFWQGKRTIEIKDEWPPDIKFEMRRQNTGACRRHPPRAQMTEIRRGSLSLIEPVTFWPETNAEEWCGDWVEAQ